MKEYLDGLNYILTNGIDKSNRTGIDTRSIFGYQMRFNLSKGFPAVTTKKLAWKPMIAELLWFLEGSTDERRLAELQYGKTREELKDKTTIWTANADYQGKNLGYENTYIRKELGPIYGYQWRNFGGSSWIRDSGSDGFDQISWLINEIKTNPDSRRLILSSWSAEQIELMALPPCHTLFHFNVTDNKLSCQLYQRSADFFLGVPFNIASYSLLTHIIADECNLQVGDFVHTIGDAHIYHNHFDAVNEQLAREPYDLPTLKINEDFDLNRVLQRKTKLNEIENIYLENYNSHPAIKAPMAV